MIHPRSQRKKRSLLFLTALALLSGCALSPAAAEGPALPEARSITAETRVTKWGQMPVLFRIQGQQLPEGIGPAQFSITGEAAGWGTQATHPFSCGVLEVRAEADGWSLIPEQFPDKYFYVRSFTVACEAAPELGFSMAELSETRTETADRFTLRETDNHAVKAWIFRPEAETPLPVVVVFHGYGDTANLLTYRTAVDWAEPEHQQARPCTVIAPVIEDALYISDNARSKTFSQVLAWIDEMVQQGTADPNRIYLMGNSFGGMSSIEMAEQFPDRIAAVLALCPALNYSRTAMANLSRMTAVPLFIAQAENDETIPVSVGRQAAEAFSEAGGEVTLKVFTDAEMEAAGAVHGQEQTYSFHHVELALLEDDAYARWLFDHVRP